MGGAFAGGVPKNVTIRIVLYYNRGICERFGSGGDRANCFVIVSCSDHHEVLILKYTAGIGLERG